LIGARALAKGKDFEELVEEFYQQLLQKKKQRAVIRRNEIVIDPDGGRECDVTIEHSLGDLTFRTLIECKDHSNPVSFGLMDALASRMTDLKFNKGVMISRSSVPRLT